MLSTDFSTTDIVLAAALRCYGYGIKTIQKSGHIGTFIFENVDQRDVADYDLGNMLVDPIMFNQHIKTLTTAVRR